MFLLVYVDDIIVVSSSQEGEAGFVLKDLWPFSLLTWYR
jgi:hypothetical protein